MSYPIELEANFYPFSPEHRLDSSVGFKSQFGINLPKFLHPFEFIFEASSAGGWDLSTCMAPFNPESGYQISREDFDPKLRAGKIERIRSSLDYFSTFNPPFAEYDLTVLSIPRRSRYLQEGEIEKYGLTFKPKPNYAAFLEALRLQLFFPNSAFEGRSTYFDDSEAEIYGFEKNTVASVALFSDFYPLDTGPLPKPDGSKSSHPLFLHVPGDRLSEISARFVLTSVGNIML